MPIRLTAVLLIFTLLTAFSCNKDNQLDVLTGRITGKWEQHYAIGGLSGRDTVYPSYPTFLTLNADRSYALEVNGQKSTGTYSLTWIKSIYTLRNEPAIIFPPNAAPARLVEVIKDSMSFIDNFTEPYRVIYSRVN